MRIRFFQSFLLLFLGVAVHLTKAQDAPNNTAIEALSRIKGLDLEANPALKGAVLKVLATTRGTPQFVEIVRDFNLTDQGTGLLECVLKNSTNSSGPDAMRLLASQGQSNLITTALQGSNAAPILTVLGNTGEKRFVPWLTPFIKNSNRDLALRQAALSALARTPEGAQFLIDLARADQLSADLRFIAMTELNNVRWPALKAAAAQVLPLPQSQHSQPLPPIAELIQQTGDSTRGSKIFRRPEVGCSNCHQIESEGIDFGPRLSEIGTKLGKDALYQSILDPSAGISFGYEAWQIELNSGDEAFGIIVSETAEVIALKIQNGIVTQYKKTDIRTRQKMNASIMPTGLQLTMSPKDLVDLIEYLTTLKKKS